MNFSTIGDLAHSFVLRRDSVALKQQIDRLSAELVSGQNSDPGRHLNGHLRPLLDVEYRLTVLSAQRTAAREAATDTAIMQTALGQVQDITGDLAQQTVTLSPSQTQPQLDTLAASARQALGGLIGALNTDVAGRSLFAGSQTNVAPLASSDALISELKASLSGATDAAEFKTRLDRFFDTEDGGFQTQIYKGGRDGISPYQLGAGESVTLNIRADDPAFRSVLKNSAGLAILAEDGLSMDPATRRELAESVGQSLRSQQTELSVLRGKLGSAEAHIARATTRITSEIAGLDVARADLIGADPFATAAKLEQAQFQLETLYTVAARVSRLNLVNFL